MNITVHRRDFLASGLAAGLTLTAAGPIGAGKATSSPGQQGRFRLNYAPHFGMFRHHAGDDFIDQIRFMADQGFTALEDSGMKRRPKPLQNRIRRELDRHGMRMGVFVATADFGNPTFSSGRKPLRTKVLCDMKESVEVAKRLNAKWCIVVPGQIDHLRPITEQTANVVETLRYCADICEPAGLVMLLEPLQHWANHPQMFLHKIPQADRICRAVGSPSCKMLFDIYHQKMTQNKLMATINKACREIAYFQIGDNPGRKEPGTGTIDYRSVLGSIHRTEFTGILGMEHGNSMPGKEGEQAVIDAYVAHDNF